MTHPNAYPAWPRVGVGAMVLRDGKILLVKRGIEPGLGLWAIPGGTLKLGETIRQCAVREILEETGITIALGDPVYTFDLIEKDASGKIRFHFVVIDFAALYLSGEPRAADDALEAGFFEQSELSQMPVSQNTIKALESIGFFD